MIFLCSDDEILEIISSFRKANVADSGNSTPVNSDKIKTACENLQLELIPSTLKFASKYNIYSSIEERKISFNISAGKITIWRRKEKT